MHAIKVHVVSKGRKYLYMRFRCPLTGEEETRSTGETSPKEAAKAAAKWEAELQEGRYRKSAAMAWDQFREFYTDNWLVTLAPGTAVNYCATLNKFEEHCKPKRLGDLTTPRVTAFAAKLREAKCRPATIARHLRCLKAVSNWAHGEKLLAAVPTFKMPKRVAGAKLMRGRPITLEEFERMLQKVAENAPDEALWTFYLRGLWLSGLRLSESLTLSWDAKPGAIVVDLSGAYPMLRIPAEAEKGHRDRILPITPDFAELLQRVPDPQRRGRVFKVEGNRTKVGSTVSAIGKAAGVVVDDTDGKRKFASAHDLRRAFGARWSRKVMPTVLRELMRHSSITTTMGYYVGDDAEATAKALWEAQGDTLGDTSQNRALQKSGENRRKSLHSQ
ncbi:tyrosine-type recombinase/integrase [Posidoniimonas polymericola]|uniref:tyrosine-type recombinase/integrase n=1 Tax=Posidoniimonas polymericola TaxID=2528002 RepID=UPI0011B5F673|nr:tyrosine-type recombinase/integrase [Posidoniimonas polymericola]